MIMMTDKKTCFLTQKESENRRPENRSWTVLRETGLAERVGFEPTVPAFTRTNA